ncbi:MAG: flagellin, partial [Fibrobacter sp.]|nr:flagellin [Fibrobacter sp.]
MRINDNISSMITQTSLYQADSAMGKSLEKLSTGLRVNRASDDAAGLAVSERLRAQVRGMDRAKMNAQDGIALLQIAEGAANEIEAILQRQRELAVQAASDTLTSADRSYLSQEFEQLTKEIDRIADATQYNTKVLLSGDFDTDAKALVLQVGANNTTGTDTMDVKIDSLKTSELTGGGNVLKDHVLSGANRTKATEAIAIVDGALDQVNSLRANLGSYINRLDHTINNLANQAYNTQDAEARIRDV